MWLRILQPFSWLSIYFFNFFAVFKLLAQSHPSTRNFFCSAYSIAVILFFFMSDDFKDETLFKLLEKPLKLLI